METFFKFFKQAYKDGKPVGDRVEITADEARAEISKISQQVDTFMYMMQLGNLVFIGDHLALSASKTDEV